MATTTLLVPPLILQLSLFSRSRTFSKSFEFLRMVMSVNISDIIITMATVALSIMALTILVVTPRLANNLTRMELVALFMLAFILVVLLSCLTNIITRMEIVEFSVLALTIVVLRTRLANVLTRMAMLALQLLVLTIVVFPPLSAAWLFTKIPQVQVIIMVLQAKPALSVMFLLLVPLWAIPLRTEVL